MEILFPAGSLEYVIAAKESGANAVYGGLKLWNARNKAVNFGIDELKHAINICHENNMKFYLTLNTLMFDDEIDEVINIIKNEKIVPDAFICADIGLMQALKENIPNIPIHASTQFGIHNIDDAKFMKKYGVERIILSRELTREEITKIIDNIKVEVEIFGWGSQCISFSGSCFLGSFVNGGTANRGKCITLCRDRFSVENNYGNFLYVPDLNNINAMDLKIDSLKLEGRRRNTDELKSVVEQIKNRDPNGFSNGYFISEFVDKNGLFEKVNSRQKKIFKHNSNNMLDPNDIFIENNEYTNTPSEIGYYVYSEIRKPFKPENFNISLEITIKDDLIVKIMMLNHKGEAKYFDKTENDFITFNFDEIINNLSKYQDLNLYSIKYKKEYENQIIKISSKMLTEFYYYIDLIYEKNKQIIENQSTALSKIYIETDNIILAEKLVKNNYNVILNIADFQIENAIDTDNFNGEIIYKLPFFNFKNKDTSQLFNKLKNQKIMLTKFSQLSHILDNDYKKIYADYLLPVWNKKSLEYLTNNNCTAFCASLELSTDKNIELFNNTDEVMFTVAGRPTCVYTRQCFKKAYNCTSCNNCTKAITNSDRDLKMNVKCYGEHREMFYENRILNAYKNMPMNSTFRYIARDESYEELVEIINTLSNDNYYEKLKEKPNFINSYSNLLKENIKVEN